MDNRREIFLDLSPGESEGEFCSVPLLAAGGTCDGAAAAAGGGGDGYIDLQTGIRFAGKSGESVRVFSSGAAGPQVPAAGGVGRIGCGFRRRALLSRFRRRARRCRRRRWLVLFLLLLRQTGSQNRVFHLIRLRLKIIHQLLPHGGDPVFHARPEIPDPLLRPAPPRLRPPLPDQLLRRAALSDGTDFPVGFELSAPQKLLIPPLEPTRQREIVQRRLRSPTPRPHRH
nr:hypothetical protein Itr_chr07CG18260 [Ipomoea trifida]